MSGRANDLNTVVSAVLRYGMLASSLLIVAGLVLLLAKSPPAAPGPLSQLFSSGYGTPSLDPATVVGGLSAANPLAVLEVGTLVLLATPLARVVVSSCIFLRERDLLYVGVTLLVLAMLLTAILVVGPAAD